MKDIPWSRLRREYEHGATYTALAEKYGTSPSSVSRRARMEGWGRRGSAPDPIRTGESMERLTEQLLEAAQRTLSGEMDNLSVKEMKELAGLVREILALRSAARGERDDGAQTVRVVLEGETEQWGV